MSTEGPRQQLASITIIIPTMNRHDLLKEALDSLCRQTRPCQQAIVIDAGDDGSDALCANYPFVRYVRQQSKGLTPARNEALALAGGDYVGMLDSDDYYEADFLKVCAGLLDQGADIAYSQGYRILGGQSEPILVNHRLPHNMIRALVADNCVIASFALQRLSCLNQVGGYRLGLPLADDFDLYLRLALTDFRFAHAARPLSNRRHHDGSLTLSNPESNVMAIRDIIYHHREALCARLGWSTARLMASSELRLGQLNFDLGNFRQAQQHFRLLVTSSPGHWRGWLYLLACLTAPHSCRVVDALKRLKRMLEAPLRGAGLLESRW